MNPLHKLISGLSLVLLVFSSGVIGLMFFEDLSLLQAIYLTVVTLSTTGFGDIVVHTKAGMILIVVILVAGVTAIAYTSGIFVSVIIEGQLKAFLGRRNMSHEIAKLKNHIIVCGAGRVGHHVVDSLLQTHEPFVVVEKDDEIVDSLRSRGILCIHGDATSDDVILIAGIQRAKGLITALSTDSDNVFVTLTSRGLNPSITIVARVEHLESEPKLLRAGADKVISPAVIGGHRMVNAMLKPASVKFVDNLLQNHQLDIEIEEIVLSPTSTLAGLKLRETPIRAELGITLVAIVRNNNVIINPSPNEVLQAGDLMVVLGHRQHLPRLEELAGNQN